MTCNPPFPPARRLFLRRAATLCLLPLTGTLISCDDEDWPEGMVAIRWDRDTCAHCGMVISDPRFAAELRGGPKNAAFKFDDIGCLIAWQLAQNDKNAWALQPETRLWVAEYAPPPDQALWLDPRQARFIVRTSPMAYNLAAVARTSEDSLSFDGVRRYVTARLHGRAAQGDRAHGAMSPAPPSGGTEKIPK